MVGLAQGCFDHTLQYVRERKQFGQKIWDFQVEHLYSTVASLLVCAWQNEDENSLQIVRVAFQTLVDRVGSIIDGIDLETRFPCYPR